MIMERVSMNSAFNKIIKSHVLLAILSVVAVALLTIGVSYSLFQIEHKNAKNQIIAVGTLDADIESISGAIVLNDLYPEKATKITDEDTKYSFTISNSGTYDIDYKIYLKDATIDLLNSTDQYSKYKKLNSDYYKYINYKLDGSDNAKNLASVEDGEGFTILTGNLKPGEKVDHYLQFFLDDKDTTQEGAPNDINGSVLSLDIYMDANATTTITDKIASLSKGLSINSDDSGIYETEDDLGTSYYFRGNVKDNYLTFAGMYFRIVRVDGAGNLRIIYDGTQAHENGSTDPDRVALNDVSWSSYNNDAKYSKYQYVYGSNENQDSDIKKVLDSWYKSNIADRGYGSSVVKSIYDNNIYSLTSSLKTDNTLDVYEVGMLSAKEIELIAIGTTANYINRGSSFWTMSGSEYNNMAFAYSYDNGNLTKTDTTSKIGVVPVLTLSNEYVNKFIGTGSMDDPYRVE